MATTVVERLAAPAETMTVRVQGKGSNNMVPQPPAMPKTKFRLDPQRALEPARKKLSTVEAQRIMASLMDAIKRTELVSALPYVIDNLDRYRVVLGADLISTLSSHKVIIESFGQLKDSAEKLMEREQKGRGSPAPTDDDCKDRVASAKSEVDQKEGVSREQSPEAECSESDQRLDSAGSQKESVSSTTSQLNMTMRNLALVAKQMQFACKNILRAFSHDPSALNAVLKDQNENRTQESKILILELNELKDILMGMLLTTPTEETERNMYLQEVSERERHNAAIIERQETELQAALDDKENEIRKKNDVIRRLQADLHQIEKFSNEHIRRTKSEAEKQEAADLKNSDGKKVKLQQEVAQLRTQLQNLVAEHRESEQGLRTKKYKIETEVENWIQKYDIDMGERQAEFEEIDAVYTEEKKQLNELEERFKTLEAEYLQIMEERRIARERREAAERELQMSVKAATIIQAFWRSYKVRKALKGKKKKAKKDKKGK